MTLIYTDKSIGVMLFINMRHVVGFILIIITKMTLKVDIHTSIS